jgi:hypothetical protein
MGKTKIERDELAKRVVHFHQTVAGRQRKLTYSHFFEEGINRKTLYRVLQRYEEQNKIITDLPPQNIPKPELSKVQKKVKRLYEANPSLSNSTGASKLKIPKSTFNRIKVHILGIKGHRKIKFPKYRNGQENRAKTNCRKIYRKIVLSRTNNVLLIDDETYVTEDREQIPGVKFYHCRDQSDIPTAKKIVSKEKFPKKYLVWQCLDENGHVSKPFITTGTMNGDMYLNKCLKPILLPFINAHHNKEDVILWMDMATCHYKKEVTDWLKSEYINFVTKTENAPNVPQARPIEKFWAICKAKYAAHSREAKNLNSFKRIWTNISTEVARTSAQAVMKEARRNLRLIAYQGVTGPLKCDNK